MKLTEIIKELEVNKPNIFTEQFLRKNIKGILSIIDNSSSYVDPDWEIEIIKNPVEYGFDQYNGWLVSNVNHEKIDECMCIFITDDLKAEMDGDGPVGYLEEYEYKGVKFKAQTIGC